MNDKELADKVVALGVGAKWPVESQTPRYHVDSKSARQNTGYLMPELFVRDWRVAGALMEKIACIEIDTIGNPWWVACNCTAGPQPHKYHKAEGESLPRAIIEACVEALL